MRVRLDNSRLQIENLKYLLVTGFDAMSTRAPSAASLSEREKRMFAALKATNDEYDDLKYRSELCKGMSYRAHRSRTCSYVECVNELQVARDELQRVHEHRTTDQRQRIEQDGNDTASANNSNQLYALVRAVRMLFICQCACSSRICSSGKWTH